MPSTEVKGFMLFSDQKAAIDCLTDEEAGLLIKAIYAYAVDGTMPVFESRLLMPLFCMIQTQIDRSQSAYEKRCRTNKANAQKRYAAKSLDSHAIATDGMPPMINSPDGSKSDADEGKNKSNNKNKENPNPNDVSDDNIIVVEDDGTFDKVWQTYGKPVGNKETLREKWNALPDADKEAVLQYIPRYVGSRPNPKYRKHFENFLAQRIWETEPITTYNDKENESSTINRADCQGQPADKRTIHERLAAEAFNSFAAPAQPTVEPGSEE